MKKHTKQILKFAVALCVVVLLLALTLLAKPEQAQPTAAETGGGIALQPPAFLQVAHAQDSTQIDFGFLVEEAGVTAYTKLNQELDLANLEPRFKNIRQQTDQFISGIITAPGYENVTELGENAEVQVFVHSEGWIIAYLTRYQIASALFDWANYDEQRLTSTLLENVVRTLALNTGVSNFNVSYYDFRYPAATNILLAAEAVNANKHSDSFEVNIPRQLIVYESSWSHAKFDDHWAASAGACTLNDKVLGSLSPGKWGLGKGELTQAQFPLGINHTFRVDGASNPAYCGIVIVYREAAK